MVTTFRGIQNTSPTSVAGGGQVADLAMQEIVRWARSVDPQSTPLLDKIGFGKPVTQPIVYFGQSYVPTLEARVEGALTSGATTITLEAGQGVRAWPTLTALIYDYQVDGVTPNVATEEIVLITAVTGDALTVARGQGGTTAQAHSDAAMVYFLAPAEAEGQYHQLGPVVRGLRQSNNVQRLDKGIAADLAAQNLPTYEFPTGGQWVRDFEQAMVDLKRLLERTLIYGGAQAETPATPVPRMMKGIRQLLVSNVYNYANELLTPRNIENVFYDIWNTTEPSKEKAWVANGKTARIINTFKNGRIQFSPNDTTIDTTVDRLKMFGGNYQILPMRNIPEGEIWLLDFNEMEVNPRKGLDFHVTEKPGKYHGADHDQKFWSGDFTLTMTNEKTMARIHGFITDLDQYDVY